MSSELIHHAVTGRILESFFEVHRVLGYGFLESVYCRALELEMRAKGLQVEREAAIDVSYKGRRVGVFRADLIVERCVVVEVKSTHRLVVPDEHQLLNCLRCSQLELGLLLHFGRRATFRRFVSTNAGYDGSATVTQSTAATNGLHVE